MKTLVVYKSKTGFTQKYAEWIAEELKTEAKPLDGVSKADLADCGTVVYGGCLHAGKILGLGKMKSLRGGAKLVLFATGAAPAYAAGAKMWAANLQAGEREAVPHFYFQGGLNYEKMDGFDKFVMKALAWVLGRAKAKNEDEAKMAKALQNSYDASSRDAIAPLVAACS